MERSGVVAIATISPGRCIVNDLSAIIRGMSSTAPSTRATQTPSTARAGRTISARDPRIATWRLFLNTHARLERLLDEDLRSAHDLTLAEYDAMLQLAESPTHRLRMHEIAVFADFQRSRNITSLDQMQPADVSAFVASRHRLKRKTVSRIVSDVRSFLQFLLLRGILQRDLSHVLPKIRVPRDATIPSVWDPELLVRLLKVVDRS